MNFSEALRHGLIQIDKLNQTVFPIVAPEEASSPFLVYKRQEVDWKKVLSGRSDKEHAIYQLILVSSSYAEKEELETLLSGKIQSFLFRNIGDDGPMIRDLDFKYLNEEYSIETDLFTSTMQIEVDY